MKKGLYVSAVAFTGALMLVACGESPEQKALDIAGKNFEAKTKALVEALPCISAEKAKQGLAADYAVVSNQEGPESFHLPIQRNDMFVIREYPAVQKTIAWKKEPNDRLSRIVAYSQHKRGIMYEAVDLEMTADNSSWRNLQNIIPVASFLKSLEKTGSEKMGCYEVEYYQGEIVYNQMHLAYLPELDLVANLYEELTVAMHGHGETGEIHEHGEDGYKASYELVDLKTQSLKPSLNRIMSYDLMDFADIGDNESDPFVTDVLGHEHGGHSH